MPGSASDPVILDPFRTIIEVGWRSVPEYIEILIPIGSAIAGDGLIACPAFYPTPSLFRCQFDGYLPGFLRRRQRD